MATLSVAANVIKFTTLSSLRTTTSTSYLSFLSPSSLITHSKSPLFSISSQSLNNRTKIPSFSFSPFCTASTHEAVPVTESTNSENGEVNVKEAAGLLDFRVGKIVRAWKHEEADSLYVEEVDVGEPEPRIICSGLVNHIPLHHLQDRKVIVLANLKPRNMRGVKSSGMLLAASDAKHENVELLFPPEEAAPGERIWFGSEDEKENQPAPSTPNQIQKKKTWESVQPHLRTDASCIAFLGEHVMRTSAGVVACQSLQNANIS